jgi:hypothetical protein
MFTVLREFFMCVIYPVKKKKKKNNNNNSDNRKWWLCNVGVAAHIAE